jgi:hypothetical protein
MMMITMTTKPIASFFSPFFSLSLSTIEETPTDYKILSRTSLGPL